ncbi:MAG: hypothetical protein RR580_07680 [Christensenellaceae bacterium]
MAIDWKAIYEEAFAKLGKGYDDQEQHLNDAKTSEQKALDTQKDATVASLEKEKDKALTQNYITRRKNERDMGSMLATQGIGGGATETSVANLLRNYQNGQNAAHNQFSDNKTKVDTAYGTDNAALASKYSQLFAGLETQKRNEALDIAQFAYSAARAEEQTAAMKAPAGGGSGGGSGGGDGASSTANGRPSSGVGGTGTSIGGEIDPKGIKSKENRVDPMGRKYVVITYNDGTTSITH